jgi:hypothetical protein
MRPRAESSEDSGFLRLRDGVAGGRGRARVGTAERFGYVLAAFENNETLA